VYRYVWWPEHIISHHQYTNDEALDVDLHHLRPARLHPSSELDPAATGFNFLTKGCFTTLGMSVLWPIRALMDQPTARYDNLITPIPAAVSKGELLASMAPVLLVFVWPLVLFAAGEVDFLTGFFIWWYPWIVTSAIWTVLTQVSHVQEDCQRPPSDSDFFRWQIESAVDYDVHNPLVPMLTASLNLQSMHHVFPSVCGCHFHALYPEYAAICRKHGVRLNSRPNLWAAWQSCVGRVFELSSPSLTPGWASSGDDAATGLAATELLAAPTDGPASASVSSASPASRRLAARWRLASRRVAARAAARLKGP